MKTRLFFSLAALVAMCFAGSGLYAQYPGGYPAQPIPGYAAYGAVMPVNHQALMPGMGQAIVPPGAMPGAQPIATMAGPQLGPPAAFIPASPALAPPSQVIPAGGHGPVQHGHCNRCGKGGKGKGGCCNSGGYDKRVAFYGEFLFLRARDSEVAFAVPIDGPIVAPPTPRVEVGPVGVADMDYQPGFVFGAAYNLNDCNQLTAEYTMFESGTSERVVAQAPFVVNSLVQHPSISNAGSDFLQADAQYDISHDIIDVALHSLLSYCDAYQLAWTIGTRYAQHEQTFVADFQGSGTENVTTDIDFYGVGVRGGLEFERYVGCQWLLYANAYSGLLAGEFKASYLQSQSFDTRVVDTSWKAGRVITTWDLELGLGRVSRCGNYRMSAGYTYSAWTNVIQTDEWIRGVHTNDFVGMDSAFTLDGLTARFEARY